MEHEIKEFDVKKQSAENEQRCWYLLAFFNSIEPRSVIIDATLSDDGTVNFCIYADDDPDLEAFALELLGQGDVRVAIANSRMGTGIYRLTEGDEAETTGGASDNYLLGLDFE